MEVVLPDRETGLVFAAAEEGVVDCRSDLFGAFEEEEEEEDGVSEGFTFGSGVPPQLPVCSRHFLCAEYLQTKRRKERNEKRKKKGWQDGEMEDYQPVHL
jgi:hypothetical protein